MDFPTRSRSQAVAGQRLEIAPQELKDYLARPHGLSELLCSAPSWDNYCWSGTELTSPMRALYVAEERGLLETRSGRALDVSIPDITNDINSFLTAHGRKVVTENSVISALGKAKVYVREALAIEIIVNKKDGTVRLIDKYETTDSVEKYLKQIAPKLKKLQAQVVHANQMGYDVKQIVGSATDYNEAFGILSEATDRKSNNGAAQ